MRIIDKIIIHCSATPAGYDFKAADIKRWHKARGFRTIGYHYVIDLDGTIERGRPDCEIGAHCLGHNASSIGICYVGGLDAKMNPRDTRTAAQRDSMRALIARLKEIYPNVSLYGHNDFDAKACPCFRVPKDL